MIRLMKYAAVMVMMASPVLAQDPAALADAVKKSANPELIGALTKEMGATVPQASGAAGALLGLAKTRLSPADFTKVSGATPQLNANASLPSVAAAKLCIDAAGRVTSATLITKLDARSAADLTSTLKTWAYAPYKNQPVCFAVSLRLK